MINMISVGSDLAIALFSFLSQLRTGYPPSLALFIIDVIQILKLMIHRHSPLLIDARLCSFRLTQATKFFYVTNFLYYSLKFISPSANNKLHLCSYRIAAPGAMSQVLRSG